MADPRGTNARLIPDSNFGQTFPPDGAPVGALGTTGLLGPLNLDASGNLLVAGNLTATLGGTTAVNIVQVGGSAIALGQALMASSFPVVFASNQSNLTTVISGTPAFNLTQIAGISIATAGAVGIPVGGFTASGSPVTGNPLLLGARAQTGEIAAVTNGSQVSLAADVLGKLVVIPYANKENFTAGAISANTTVLQTVIGSSSGKRFYLTSMQMGNTSGSTILVTFNDIVTSNFVVPSGGGNNPLFPTPLVFNLGSAVAATCSLAVGTAYINCQGYFGV